MQRLLLLPFMVFLGCQQSTENFTASPPPTDHIITGDSNLLQETTVAQEASSPVLDTLHLSPEPSTPLKLLMEGTFHKQEVWQNAEKKPWLGLFFRNGKYELQSTELQVNVVKDPIMDEAPRLLSGRQVLSSIPDAAFLVTGLRSLKAGPIDTAVISRTALPANRELTYTLRDKTYTISSYGDSTLKSGAEYTYQNYGWRVSGTRNGRKVKQTLAEDESFDDSIYVLLWAGDLDRDGIPDLLLDLSNHYNVSRYTLFLSSLAERGELYKKAAVFEAVGS